LFIPRTPYSICLFATTRATPPTNREIGQDKRDDS